VSEYFTCKQIFWVCADISRCAHIFWDVHIHFDWKRIFCVYINILGKRQYVNDFTVSSAQFIFAISFACFCNKFCLNFAANICVYFQYLFMHVVCTNIFGANVWSLGLRLM
jgi:hypothetical protein